MGRLAIELEKILAACRDKGVPETTITQILSIYKRAYREGYHDGTMDWEEAHDDGERRLDED
jgi:hypothetical protein